MLWLYREQLARKGMIEKLSDAFDGHLKQQGYLAMGGQSNDRGGTLVRSIGLVRARARIGLKNLAYNMRRLVQLERLAMAGAA